MTPEELRNYLLNNKFGIFASDRRKGFITLFVNDVPFFELDFEKAIEIADALVLEANKSLDTK